MAAIPPKEYLIKIDEFLAHWALVNAALAPSAMILQGGYAVAGLQAERAALAAQLAAVEAANNNLQGASADRDNKIRVIRERMRQFNQSVRGFLPGSQYAAMLPHLPNISAAPGLYTRALDEIAHCWNRINTDAPPPVGFTPPLLLVGGYTRANFVTEQAAVNAAFTTYANSVPNAVAARDLRDQMFAPIHARLVQYRPAVKGKFPAGSALINSIPTLTPAPGSTPAPVNVSGVWDAALKKAVIQYSASSAPTLKEYQLRGCFGGTKYDTNTESVIASNGVDELEFETDEGLLTPGAVLWAKVYVITSTGNEKGSVAVKITRP
jgi:hypothetical protein